MHDKERQKSLESVGNILQSITTGGSFTKLLDEDVAKEISHLSPQFAKLLREGTSAYGLLSEAEEGDLGDVRDSIMKMIESGDFLSGFEQKSQALSLLQADDLSSKETFRSVLDGIFATAVQNTLVSEGDYALYKNMNEERLQANLHMMLGANTRTISESGEIMKDLKLTLERVEGMLETLDAEWTSRRTSNSF